MCVSEGVSKRERLCGQIHVHLHGGAAGKDFLIILLKVAKKK